MLLKQSVYEFFCVCVFHKKLCSSQCFYFLLFLFLDSVSGRVGKFLSVFPSVVAVDTCDQSQMYFVDNLANDRAYFLKFRV